MMTANDGDSWVYFICRFTYSGNTRFRLRESSVSLPKAATGAVDYKRPLGRIKTE